MAKLQRVISGNVFIDNFDEANLDSRWTISPSLDSRYSLVERPGYLRMKHAESSTYILTNIPAMDTIMFDIKNDYKPAVSTDIGGIVVFKTLSDRVELVEYYDPVLDVSRNYLYVRMFKSGDVYDGYGSQDGVVWELIGSVRVEDAAKIGLVLNGEVSPLSENFDIDYVSMYKDRFLYVENLQENMIANLYDKNNVLQQTYTVPTDGSIAKFDMFSLPIPFEGYIQLLSPASIFIEQTESQLLYPGDEFQYMISMTVKFQRKRIVLVTDDSGNTIPTTVLEDDVDFMLDGLSNIGRMDDSTLEGLITVTNLDNADISNIEAYIELYTDSYASHTVKLSKDDMGTPLNYQDVVAFTVSALSSYSFWIRISVNNINSLSKKDMFKYKLCFRNI